MRFLFLSFIKMKLKLSPQSKPPEGKAEQGVDDPSGRCTLPLGLTRLNDDDEAA